MFCNQLVTYVDTFKIEKHQVDSFMPPDSKVQRCLRNDESRSSARRWDMDTSHSPTSEEWIEQRMEGFFGGSKMMVETC